MKKYIARIVVMLLIASVLPLQVSAAEKESIELAVEAEQVGVSLTLPQSVSGNILSLQVGLKLDSNVQEETTATFQFSENVAKVADYRYNQEKGILNIPGFRYICKNDLLRFQTSIRICSAYNISILIIKKYYIVCRISFIRTNKND